MNKFGLLDDEDDAAPEAAAFAEKLSMFSSVRPKQIIDLAAVDAAGAPHGFISREPTAIVTSQTFGRRRRAIPSEPTRHLAIRLASSSYDRFVAYADRHKLTYHDALAKLLDDASA